MNIQLASYKYISYILASLPGPKVVLYDEETLPILSMTLTKTELLSSEVVLTDDFTKITQGPYSGDLSSLPSVCFLRPTDENINQICTELGHPHFVKYTLIFTNVVSEAFLRQIASRDSNSLVNSIQEAFLDVYPIGTRIFSINTNGIRDIRDNYMPMNPKITRIVDGIFSNLCSLKIRPQIRYDKSSNLCQNIANSISRQVNQYVDIFSAQPSPHLLLILDRNSDPVTPLLHHWYYNDAIHELFGIKDNTVLIGDKQLVLDERTDFIFSEFAYKYLGDVFQDVTKKLEALKVTAESIKTAPTDISGFHEKIAKVSRGQEEKTRLAEHVNILDAIQSKVNGDKLSLTQLEQVVATDSDIQQMLELTIQAIKNPSTSEDDCIRLAMVFILHFNQYLDQIDAALAERFVTESRRSLLHKASELSAKVQYLFGDKSRISQIIKSVKSFKQVNEDQYDLFKPLVSSIIKKISEMTLKEDYYPYVQKNSMCSVKPAKVIVFVVGGVTYEEARICHLLSTKDFEVIVGGTDVINAKQYIEYELM